MFTRYTYAAAYFVGHVNIYGDLEAGWRNAAVDSFEVPEVILPLLFFKRYNQNNGSFGSCSLCSIRKSVLGSMGSQPFKSDGTEDFYCTALFSLIGPVVYLTTPLVAYRVRSNSHSSKRIRGLDARVKAFEMLEEYYEKNADHEFATTFHHVFASHRRLYAKYLMVAGLREDARLQLRCSIRHARGFQSVGKSIGLLFMTYWPRALGWRWPMEYRR